jgi:hypothetical protein
MHATTWSSWRYPCNFELILSIPDRMSRGWFSFKILIPWLLKGWIRGAAKAWLRGLAEVCHTSVM